MKPMVPIAGPAVIAVAAFGLACGAAYSAVSTIPVEHLAMRAEVEIIAPRPTAVLAGHAPIDRILASVGQHVAAGDVVASVDTAALDREIEALKEKSASVRRQHDAVLAEAQSIAILHGHGLVPRSRLTDLEAQLATLEQASRDLGTRTQSAEERLARTNIKAPLSGTLTMLALHVDGRPFQRGETLLQIAADDDRLYLEGQLPQDMVALLAAGDRAMIGVGRRALLSDTPVQVRLVSTDERAEADGETAPRRVRLEAEFPRSALRHAHLLEPGSKVVLTVAGRNAGLSRVAESLRRHIRNIASSSVSGD